MRDTLPRIRYANPIMPIEADRVWKEEIDSSIQLVFGTSMCLSSSIQNDSKVILFRVRENVDYQNGRFVVVGYPYTADASSGWR